MGSVSEYHKNGAPFSSDLQFVTVTSSAPRLTAKSRCLIKRHVMKDIGFARRKYNSTELQITSRTKKPAVACARRDASLPQSDSSGDSSWESEILAESIYDVGSMNRSVSSSPATDIMLGTGCLGPFNSLPIRSDAEVHTLVYHINDDSRASFKLFREYWFPLAIHDSAAFHCTLSLAAQHRMALYPRDSEEHLRHENEFTAHYAAAIRSVAHRITDPVQNTSNEMITAILLLACDPTPSDIAENYTHHMDGLKTIIRLRGGVKTLDSNRSLRLLLFWIDTIGSAALHRSPIFQMPTQFLPRYDREFSRQLRPRLAAQISADWTTLFPSHFELVSILDDLCALTILVETEALQKYPNQEPRFTGFYIVPLVYRLFTLGPEENDDPQDRMIFEACKLTAFLYLQQLRYFVARRYPCLKEPFFEQREASAVTLTATCVQRLEEIMYRHSVVWTVLEPLKCWALTIGANSAYLTPGLPTHLHEIMLQARSLKYNDWCTSMGSLMCNSWTQIFYKLDPVKDWEYPALVLEDRVITAY